MNKTGRVVAILDCYCRVAKGAPAESRKWPKLARKFPEIAEIPKFKMAAV